MGVIDKIRALFASDRIPEETKALIKESDHPQQILEKLDTLVTENEVRAREVQSEVEKLEQLEVHHKGQIRKGGLNERQKRGLAMEIQRLRKKMDTLESRHRIYDQNIHLHMNLMASIQDIMARQLAGVTEDVIDSIALKAEEAIEEHDKVLTAAEVPADQERQVQLILREIEAEGTAEEGPAREAEAPAKAPPEKEREAEEREGARRTPDLVRTPIEEAIERKSVEPEEPDVAPEREIEME